MSDDNSVFIGRKPAMNYVLAVVTQFNKGNESVIVKARGKSISRAVDVVEIVRKRFITNLDIVDIAISTETLVIENKHVNVSSMEITISKRDEKGAVTDEKKPSEPEMKPEEKPDKKPAPEPKTDEKEESPET